MDIVTVIHIASIVVDNEIVVNGAPQNYTPVPVLDFPFLSVGLVESPQIYIVAIESIAPVLVNGVMAIDSGKDIINTIWYHLRRSDL